MTDLETSQVRDLFLARLNISQLKNSYSLFQQQPNYQVEFFYHHNFSYYLFRDDDDSLRVLFYPVTLHEASEPSACDLFSLLNFVRLNSKLQSLSINQIIIPFGEKGQFPFLHSVNHMVTLVIDLLPCSHYVRSVDSHPSMGIRNRSPVNVRIIDSLGFSVPFCHQTNGIYNILKIFYLVIKFDREYLGHQSLLDNESCCYFTVKVIEKLLSIHTGASLSDKIQTFIPKPNTWFGTSQNWLTCSDRSKIKETILGAFERSTMDADTVKMINDSIIEIE